MSPRGLGLLRQHLQRGSTGELVAAEGELEVHVFVQDGRIAWGHSSSAKLAFRAHLVKHHGVREADFDALVREGLKTRAKVGEALLARGLVTREALREALLAQVRASVRTLESLPSAVFLEREARAGTYDVSLTFSLDEVLLPAQPALPRREAPAPARHPVGASTSPQELMAAVPGLTWAVSQHEGVAADAWPPGTPPPPWAEATLGLGAWLAILRRPGDTVLGVRTRQGSLWGGMSTGSPLNVALEAFRARAAAPSVRTLAVDSTQRAVGRPEAHGVLRALLASEPLVYAAAVASHQGDISLVARGGVPENAVLASVGERHLMLREEPVPAQTEDAVRLALAEGPCWWFGTRWWVRPEHTVWILTADALGLGLGQAVLRSLAQRVYQEVYGGLPSPTPPAGQR